jgi:hypothetical protein
MKNNHTSQKTRHGMRAEGIKILSIPVPNHIKKEIEQMAKAELRTTAAFLRIHLISFVRKSIAARKGRK